MHSTTTASTADRECLHSRVIAAPPEAVYAALTLPERVARWWGPDGFSSEIDTFDFRPGGDWRFTMIGPDGARYPNQNRFVELVAAEWAVIEHVSDTHHFVLTITLEAEGGHTRVGWRQVFDDAAHRDAMADFVRPANEQNLARLAAEVARGA